MLTFCSIILSETAIQRDKRGSILETTLFKYFAGVALNAALIFVLRSAVLVGLVRNTTPFT